MHLRGALVVAAAVLAASFSARAAAPESGDADAEFERGLDRKVSFEFNNTPMTEALQFLQVLTQISVVVDPWMSREKATAPVTLKVTDVPLRDAILQVLSPVGLEYAIRHEALFVHEKGAPGRATGKPVLSKELKARLENKVTLELVETPLREAVGFIERLGGVPIELPKAVARAKGATPITLKVKNMRVGLVIEWVMQIADLGYEQRGEGLVCVLPPEAKEPPPARREQIAKPKPAFPTIMAVVDCTKASNMKAARDLLVYLTRNQVPDVDASDSTFGPFRLIPAASIAAAQKAAAKAGAFGILRVVIMRRAPEARMRGSHIIDTTCVVYMPASSAFRTRPKWERKVSRRISYSPYKERLSRLTPSRDGLITVDGPWDFVVTARDVAALVRDAAVELKKPRVVRAPDGGKRLDVEVTNNTRHAILRLRAEFGTDAKVPGSYSGEPILPGTKRVTMSVPGADAWRLRQADLAPKVLSLEFREAAAEE